MAGGINSPLDILGGIIMRLDQRSKLCQCARLDIGEASFFTLRCSLERLCPPSGDCLYDHLLIAQAALDDLARGRTDYEVVRVCQTGDNCFTQARIGINHRLAALSRKRIGGEEHSSDLGIHHALDDDSQSDSAMVYVQTCAVADCPFGPQRCPTALYCCKHGLDPDDIEIRLLLTGKASIGQVFSSRGGTHSDRNRVSIAQRPVCFSDGGYNACRYRCL